ncbi:small GTP-binding protein [Histomonas meleagridis]|uniref:small GTP-binding protein n=1 Tax=Histomonas meleagridis TaxID=135588 RepID=UPI003559D9EE|nr:small GTP-binding protein [Histomonas meleagridis]KAH0797985.1 small GTP-binding protein [Histomonas meleagridis]
MNAQTGFENAPNIKLVLLGQSTVGKTSIVNVVHGGEFIPDQTATIGACFHIKKMKVNDVALKLHIWDTAGQERFRSLAPMYYRDAQFALLVYAIDNPDSFNAIDTWYRGLCDDCPEMPHVVLIANKNDLVDNRQVTTEQGKELAAKLNSKFYEVSAKEDPESINRMIEEIAEVASKDLSPNAGSPNTIEKVSEKERKNKCC